MRMTRGWRLHDIYMDEKRIKWGWHVDAVCPVCAWDYNKMRMTCGWGLHNMCCAWDKNKMRMTCG